LGERYKAAAPRMGKTKMGIRSVTVLLLIALTSCVSPKVIETPSVPVDFSQFETVSYTIEYDPNTSRDRDFGKSTVALFDAMLRIKLRAMGYRVVDLPAFSNFSIDVIIKAVTPGNAALRFFIGFGAGRAILLFDAHLVNAAGDRIASFEGGRSHTGMEFGEGFAGKDQIQAIAVTKSVKQIHDFFENNGAFSYTRSRWPRKKHH
jgi:hypothetical protein